MFLTNNSPDLHALTLCIVLRKNAGNWLLARLPRISANSNKNYRSYNFQVFANRECSSMNSGKFTILTGNTALWQSTVTMDRLHLYPVNVTVKN